MLCRAEGITAQWAIPPLNALVTRREHARAHGIYVCESHMLIKISQSLYVHSFTEHLNTVLEPSVHWGSGDETTGSCSIRGSLTGTIQFTKEIHLRTQNINVSAFEQAFSQRQCMEPQASRS
jgi:hypothetical protein